MHVDMASLEIELPDARLMPVHRRPRTAAIDDVPAAVHDALEHPLGFPALRRALTPDDHVAIVVDEKLIEVPRFLSPILEHLNEAHVTPDAITLICTDPGSHHEWRQRLGHCFRDVRIEVHDPHNRKKLSYLAATKHGRRVYLNRTAVDADQLVVLSRRHYDPLLGIGGAEGAIYPALGDAETQTGALAKLSMAAPDQRDWPVQQEAAEIAWLIGAPFFVQVVEGAGGEVAHVLGGLSDSSAEGLRLQDERWRVETDALADVVVAQVSGDPDGHTFDDLARALACASRVVKPEGRIILISGGKPDLGPGAELMRQCDTAAECLQLLIEKKPPDLPAAYQWASAACHAKLFLVSELPKSIVEELFMTPLESGNATERAISQGRCLYLPDADRSLALVRRNPGRS